MARVLLWLDDERDPRDPRWHAHFPVDDVDDVEVLWVRSFDAFVAWINAHGLPAAICFDHDLGMAESGHDAAKWLVDYCLAEQCKLPMWACQSANPIGRANIECLLDSFHRSQQL